MVHHHTKQTCLNIMKFYVDLAILLITMYHFEVKYLALSWNGSKVQSTMIVHFYSYLKDRNQPVISIYRNHLTFQIRNSIRDPDKKIEPPYDVYDDSRYLL